MGAHRVELTGYHRRRGRPAQGARPHLGDHRLAPAALRADRRRSRPGNPRRDPRPPSAARRPLARSRLIRRCAVISQAADLARRLARDAEAVCRHYLSNGSPPRAATGSSAMSATRRAAASMSASHGPDCGPGAAGKWTDAATGEHGDLLDLIGRNRDLCRLGDAHRRSPLLPRPAAPGRSRTPAQPPPCVPPRIPPKLPAACSAPAVRSPARWPKPICAPGASPRPSTGPPCATTRRSTTAQSEQAPLETWPALLAAVTDLDGHITGIQRTWLDPRRPRQGAARRSAPGPGPSPRQRRPLR